MFVVVDRDDVEAHVAVRKLRLPRDKQRRGSDEFALLMNIDSLSG